MVLTLNILRDLIQSFNSKMACKICWRKKSYMLYLPCGHFTTCIECDLMFHSCPVCRQEIQGLVKCQIILPLRLTVTDGFVPPMTNDLKLHEYQIKALQIERDILKDMMKCFICKENPREVTFLPCGDLSVCSRCAESTSTCPVCHSKTLAEIKTFLG